MAEPSDDSLLGQLIDRRYRVVRKLGGGGMGTVYEVQHALLQDRRALKLIKRELAQEPGYRQRFFREAQWLNESRHPHIVAVHDFQEDAEYGLFIVMELIRGVTLKALLQEQTRLEYTEVLRIGREVALALEHVHRLGRVHRDIKPANILVEEGSGRAVVTDFGIAKDLGTLGDETLTETHQVVGTLNYASPEQIGGDRDSIDERSDIYSLGAVLYEMYAGRHYGGIGSASRLKYPEPPPEDFYQLVRSCLELDSERRLANASELIRRLRQCETTLRTRDAGASTASSPRPPTAAPPETDETQATLLGTEAGPAAPPSQPSEGTGTMQQRAARELRDQTLGSQLEELHREVHGLRGQNIELHRHLSRFDVSAEGLTPLEELSDRLAEIEREPDLERQRARLEALIDDLTQGRDGTQTVLQEAVTDATRRANEGVDRLAGLGAGFVNEPDLVPLRTALDGARRNFAAHEWKRGHEALQQAGRLLDIARLAARDRAGELVAGILAGAADTVQQIRDLGTPEEDLPALEAARAQAITLINADRLPEARDRATRFAEEAALMLAELRERGSGVLASSRRRRLAAIAGSAIAAAALGALLFLLAPWSEWTATRVATNDGDANAVRGDAVDDAKPPEVAAPAPAVNRPPAIAAAKPAPGARLEAKAGEVVSLNVDATDPDRDELKYAWTVDGKPAGTNGPALEMRPTGDHKVALNVSDGTESTSAEWQVALAKPPPFKLESSPSQLERVRFQASQKFSLRPPRGQSAEGVKVDWAVGGEKVAEGLEFVFKADDPEVAGARITLVATAANAEGEAYSREWSFAVTPPGPQILRADPAGDEIDGQPGNETEFRVEAGKPTGAQRFTYLFSVDGREVQKGEQDRFRFEDRDATVTAKVEDNYGQSSLKTWKIRVSDIVARSRQWLAQYEAAFQAKNAARIAELRGLNAGDTSRLAGAFAAQRDLEVIFSGTKVESLDGNRSRVSYDMSQRFTGPDGRAQRSRSSCSHVLALEGGNLTDTSPTPCSRVE